MRFRSIAKWPSQLLAVAILCLALVGCQRTARNLSLDEDKAKEACETFLTAWKSGGSYVDLEPDITSKDEDWDAKRKLVAFKLLPNEFSDGANLHIPVRLTLKEGQGAEYDTDVIYIVGTSPMITVFRE